jgi:HTH-type transcriptional regulator, transcriptional repressor of NAD biosynthesis genes
MTVGFVLGKFMPPHKGHMLLTSFALEWVDRLYIVVESVVDEPIPSALRYSWMKEMFPQCHVLHLEKHQPQDPAETIDFWNIWKNTLEELLPEPIDFVFASEAYGTPLANILGACFVPVDCNRKTIPISATQIRTAPFEHWQEIPNVVQNFYRKKISIFGPESTGKTTLARKLADFFNGRYIPEYARTYIEASNGELEADDMWKIARGQSIMENISYPQAGPVLVCDTDPLATTIWMDWLYKTRDVRIEQIASQHSYDVTLLLDVDTPWVADPIRYFPKDRERFFTDCKQALIRAKRPFVIIQGDWETRMETAKRAVIQLWQSSSL